MALGYWRVELEASKREAAKWDENIQKLMAGGERRRLKGGDSVGWGSELREGVTGYSRWTLVLWQRLVRRFPGGFVDEQPPFLLPSFIKPIAPSAIFFKSECLLYPPRVIRLATPSSFHRSRNLCISRVVEELGFCFARFLTWICPNFSFFPLLFSWFYRFLFLCGLG